MENETWAEIVAQQYFNFTLPFGGIHKRNAITRFAESHNFKKAVLSYRQQKERFKVSHISEYLITENETESED